MTVSSLAWVRTGQSGGSWNRYSFEASTTAASARSCAPCARHSGELVYRSARNSWYTRLISFTGVPSSSSMAGTRRCGWSKWKSNAQLSSSSCSASSACCRPQTPRGGGRSPAGGASARCWSAKVPTLPWPRVRAWRRRCSARRCRSRSSSRRCAACARRASAGRSTRSTCPEASSTRSSRTVVSSTLPARKTHATTMAPSCSRGKRSPTTSRCRCQRW
mmetsp:Transcript_16130/g.26234  ORF Transcript_16130/g.26234 Transcript_16130/m.26234 type:complete len:219 (+) Transcript_16130:1551-2207(+)